MVAEILVYVDAMDKIRGKVMNKDGKGKRESSGNRNSI